MSAQQYTEEKQPGILRSILNLLICIVVVIVAVWALRSFVIEPFEVPSGSMETTIMTDDRIFAEKITYLFDEPEYGDIVVFTDPQVPARTLVKRVIATEGQTVNLIDGVVYVDGEALNESYTTGSSYPLTNTAVTINYPYTLGEGEVWVMGDNRENSSDSRYFGAIDASTIYGKVIVTYWPLNHIGLLN